MRLIELRGDARAQGRAHGEALREDVHHNIEHYLDTFAALVGLSRDEAFAAARSYAERLRVRHPDYVAGMEGVADGASAPLESVITLNVRYELLYLRVQKINSADGCTAFAVRAEDGLVQGQNWDWLPFVRGSLVHSVDPDGTEILGFTEAGIVGAKIGLNSAGLGLTINGMFTTRAAWSTEPDPFHVRCHRILRCGSLDEAIAVASAPPHGAAANFLLAQPPDRVRSIEVGPTGTAMVAAPGSEPLVHGNHSEDPEALGEPHAELALDWLPDSCARRDRLTALLREAPVTPARAQAALADHGDADHPLCRHAGSPGAGPPFETLISVVMNLDTREFWAAEGPPCSATFGSHSL